MFSLRQSLASLDMGVKYMSLNAVGFRVRETSLDEKQGNINSSEFSPILDKCIPTSLESHNSLSLSEMLEKIYLYNSRVLKDEEHDSAFRFVEFYLEEWVKSYFLNVYHNVVSLLKKIVHVS